MTPSQMLGMLRRYISDEQATGFTDGGSLEQPEGTQELLSYLDRAVDEYSKRQALEKDLRQVKSLTVRGTMSLPSDFLSFCGTVPIEVTAKTLSYYGDGEAMPVKYFSRLPYVSSYGMDNELPYEVDQYSGIIALASVYALNKQEYNVSQDLALLGYGAMNGNAVEQAQ